MPTGPIPPIGDLDDLLPKVTRVCLLDGAMFRGRPMGGRVLLDSRDASTILDLASCLQIVEDPSTFGHCGCLGGPTMELYAGLEHVATIGLQHGRAIRWNQWYHDAQLQSGDRLRAWLHKQGVDPAELEAIYRRGNNFLYPGGSQFSEHQKAAQQLCSQAQQWANEGRLTEALELCTRAIGLDTDQGTMAYDLRGQILYHLGRLPEAAADFSAAIDRGLRRAKAYFIRAVFLDAAGLKTEALADCSMALHLDPESAEVYNGRGLICGRLGRLDEALRDFAAAIRLAPSWFLPYLHRAQLYQHSGQLDSALADFDCAVELAKEASPEQAGDEGDPRLALVYFCRGDALHDRFRDEEAEADFAEARRHHAAAAATHMGEMWLRRCQFDKALEEFDQLVRLRPDDAQGYVRRGVVQESLGDLEQAADDYSEAIRRQPDGGGGYARRAGVRHRQGRPDDALADISEHLRLNPDDPMAYLFRSALHAERKELAAALEDLNSAHRADPNNPQVCNNLAWMLATSADDQLRDGDRAVALARQACEATGWEYSFCLGTLAAALAETGAFDEAAHWQSEALKLYPEEEKPAGQSRLARYLDGQPHRE
jgi:tetratricopeptide (TPR) repeat protein